MRRLAVLILLVAAGCAGQPSAEPTTGSTSSTNGTTVVPVLKVTDGDTIHVRYQGEDERVRLIGIDTPEVSWYGGEAECYGAEAGIYARSRLSGRTVRLAFDVELRDRYGRLLAYVYLGTELFNLTLVREGYATADPVPPDTRLATTFEQAERAAKATGKGLWSVCKGM